MACQLAQFCSGIVYIPSTLNNLTVGEWLGPTRHPPRSLLRPILVLIDLRGLRSFVLQQFQTEAIESSTRDRVPWFFFVIDETCFFTYAQYVEPFSSVTINDLRRALVHRVLQTWGFQLRTAMINIQIADRQGHIHTLNGEDTLFQILGAYHPFWFRGGDRTGYLVQPVSPFCPYALRLTCTGVAINTLDRP